MVSANSVQYYTAAVMTNPDRTEGEGSPERWEDVSRHAIDEAHLTCAGSLATGGVTR